MEYEFKDGILRHKVSGLQYDRRGRNDYEKIGNYAIAYVFEELIRLGLKCVTIPEKSRPPKDPVSFIFVSESLLLDNADKLLILIHGSGAVRAGVWSRSLLTHEDINVGSQLEYVRFALSKGYAVLLMNTNLNNEGNVFSDPLDKSKIENDASNKNCKFGDFLVGERTWLKMAQQGRVIECSKTPEDHAYYVWKNFVLGRKSLLKIAIVAHSYGCQVLGHLISKFANDFQTRVSAICLTDGLLQLQRIDGATKQHILEVARHWKCSSLPLDSKMKDRGNDEVETVSAGTTEHDRSNSAAAKSVFSFIEQALIDEEDELNLPVANIRSQIGSYNMSAIAPLSSATSNTQANVASFGLSGLNLPSIPIAAALDNRLSLEAMDHSSESEPESVESEAPQNEEIENMALESVQLSTAVENDNRLHLREPNTEENIDLAAKLAGINPLSIFTPGPTPIQGSESHQLPQEQQLQAASNPTNDEKKEPEKKKKSSHRRIEQPTAVRVETFNTYQSIDSSNRTIFDDEEELTWTNNF